MANEKKMSDILHEKECGACKAFFRDTLIDASGRCPVCVEENNPVGGKQKQDYIQEESMKKENLKALIREVLQELKDEEEREKEEEKETAFAPKICKVCGKEFVPRAPAQQRCETCIENEKNSK